MAPADPCYHGSPGTAIAESPLAAAHRPDGTDRAPLTRDYRMLHRGGGSGGSASSRAAGAWGRVGRWPCRPRPSSAVSAVSAAGVRSLARRRPCGRVGHWRAVAGPASALGVVGRARSRPCLPLACGGWPVVGRPLAAGSPGPARPCPRDLAVAAAGACRMSPPRAPPQGSAAGPAAGVRRIGRGVAKPDPTPRPGREPSARGLGHLV